MKNFLPFRFCSMPKTVVSGFTLLELLLTVALVALIMTIIYGVLDSTLRANDLIEEIAQNSEIGPTILKRISDDLEGAFLPGTEEYFAGVHHPSVYGDNDRIDFVTTTFAYGKKLTSRELGALASQEDPKFYSVNKVGYQLRQNEQEPDYFVLYRREDLWLDDKPLQGGRLYEMYDRVLALHLEYYDGNIWQTDWSNVKNNQQLPQAVKIQLKLAMPNHATGGLTFDEREFSTTVLLQ